MYWSLVGLWIQPAASHPWGPTDNEFADNGSHTFALRALEPDTATRARDAFTYLDAGTDMSVSEVQPTSLTDVLVYDADYDLPNGDWGWADCLSFNSANECEQHRIRLDLPQLGNLDLRRKVLCHEVGHTVGVRHYFMQDAVPGGERDSNGCMVRGNFPNNHGMSCHEKTAHINTRADYDSNGTAAPC